MIYCQSPNPQTSRPFLPNTWKAGPDSLKTNLFMAPRVGDGLNTQKEKLVY
ncbi:hypothetical protein BGS_0535 [Beggiatoa sp. SS]|nr:hypothetical protein BGS_0535 [Beggiatoa sp. SS]